MVIRSMIVISLCFVLSSCSSLNRWKHDYIDPVVEVDIPNLSVRYRGDEYVTGFIQERTDTECDFSTNVRMQSLFTFRSIFFGLKCPF